MENDPAKHNRTLIWTALIAAAATVAAALIGKCPAGPLPQATEKSADRASSADSAASPADVPPAPGPPATQPKQTSAGPASSPAAEAVASNLNGQVIDKTNPAQGLARVQIRCLNCRDPEKTVVTDAEGYFRLPYRIEPGGSIQQLQLSLSKDGVTQTIEESASQKTARIVF